MSRGTYNGPVNMLDGVSLLAGYAYHPPSAGVPADFVFKPDAITILTNDTPNFDNVLYVVKADNIQQQTLLQNLTIKTEDAGANLDVRAIWAYKAPGLFLRDLIVEPGAGKSSIALFSDYSNFLTIQDSQLIAGDALGAGSDDTQTCDGCSMAVFCPDMLSLVNPCPDKVGCTGLTLIGEDSKFFGSEEAAKSGAVSKYCVSYPHSSCLDIKNALVDVESGVYFIDPDGPLGVFPEVEVYLAALTLSRQHPARGRPDPDAVAGRNPDPSLTAPPVTHPSVPNASTGPASPRSFVFRPASKVIWRPSPHKSSP